MNSFKIPLRRLLGVMKAAPKNDVRYYLCGVHVDTMRSRLVATDGHCALIARDEAIDGMQCEPFTIPRAGIEAVAKTTNKDSVVEIQIDGERIVVKAERNEFAFKALDGRYPDVDRIAPKTCSGEYASLDPDIVIRVRDGIRIFLGSQKLNTQAVPNGASNPAIVMVPGAPIVGIIMPQRLDSIDDAIDTAARLVREVVHCKPARTEAA